MTKILDQKEAKALKLALGWERDVRRTKSFGSKTGYRVRQRYLMDYWGDGKNCTCVYCGKVLDLIPVARDLNKSSTHITVDRVVPGTRYTRDNVVPACYACNTNRGNKPFKVWCKHKGVNHTVIFLRMQAAHIRWRHDQGTLGQAPTRIFKLRS